MGSLCNRVFYYNFPDYSICNIAIYTDDTTLYSKCPTLSLLYMNYFPFYIICNIAIYTDDTALYTNCSSLSYMNDLHDIICDIAIYTDDITVYTKCDYPYDLW